MLCSIFPSQWDHPPILTYSVVYTALLKFGQDLSDIVVGVVLVADMCNTYLQKPALYYIRVIYPIVVLSRQF